MMNAPIRVQYANAALADLEALEAFLAHAGGPQAWPLMDFVFDGLAVLTHQPGIVRPVEAGLRELILRRGKSGYLVKYRLMAEKNSVRVLRIRHQRQSGYADI